MREMQTSAPGKKTSAADEIAQDFRENLPAISLKTMQSESDAGNARRFAIDHIGDIKHVAAWRRWYIWDGFGYREDTKSEILLRAVQTARSIVDEVRELPDGEKQKRRLKHAIQSQNQQKLHAMLELAAAQPEIAVSPGDFDAQPDLLGVANGVVNLRTGELLNGTTRNMITRRAGAAYCQDAACPLFLEFLGKVMGGRDDLVQYVRRAVGYSITGHTSEQLIFVSIGTGANGKTTLHELWLDLLGEYAARTPAEALLVSHLQGAQIPNDLARLAGKRLVVATEIEQGRRLNEARVKEITGGDTLTARFMRGEWFDFRPQFKVWLAGNHLPRIHGADHGIWRRIRLIEFNVTIPAAEQDRRLQERLRDELPGILLWAVEGARAWYGDGLKTPDDIRRATEQYRDGEDVLGQFLAERCAVELDGRTALKDLAEAYNLWAEANSERRTSSRSLGAWLEERGYRKERGSGNAVLVTGIRLKVSY